MTKIFGLPNQPDPLPRDTNSVSLCAPLQHGGLAVGKGSSYYLNKTEGVVENKLDELKIK